MKLSKVMTNLQIAELLRAIAASYQLKDAKKNKFRIIAYQRAADAVEHSSSELKDLWDEAKLKDVPGIGESIAAHLDELFRIGDSKHFQSVMKGLPPAMFELMEVPGIGAKTAFKLTTELKIGSIAELEKAAKSGKLAGLEGFGEQSQTEIIRSIEETKGRTKRHLLPYASKISEDLIAWLKKDESVKQAEPLGSLRRRASTVGDIDIAIASDNSEQVLKHFTAYPNATRTLEKGDRTASLILPGDVQVDLMVQPQDSFGALLQHFTGSKHHNIALREYALKHGMSLSEYGIKRHGKLTRYPSEEAFYKSMGMDWIPPELREDSGEIEAALNHKIPKLVEAEEVKADLQIHSSFDIETSHDIGESSMAEIVEKANELGYSYLAFTEHNPSRSRHTEGQIIDILRRKREAIDKLNYSIVKKTGDSIQKVFNSLEIDILPEGGLPVPEEGLNTLDFALVSIHSSFRLSRGAMTRRVLSALKYPQVKIFAHPTARKLNEREGVELNWPEIFEFCIKNDKWLEINADPSRLDLPDTLVKEAVKAGVKLCMGTDAHHKDSLDNMPYAVSVARRGWATKADIVNTYDLKEFEGMLH
jgi:DNA polymerase (family 10)